MFNFDKFYRGEMRFYVRPQLVDLELALKVASLAGYKIKVRMTINEDEKVGLAVPAGYYVVPISLQVANNINFVNLESLKKFFDCSMSLEQLTPSIRHRADLMEIQSLLDPNCHGSIERVSSDPDEYEYIPF